MFRLHNFYCIFCSLRILYLYTIKYDIKPLSPVSNSYTPFNMLPSTSFLFSPLSDSPLSLVSAAQMHTGEGHPLEHEKPINGYTLKHKWNCQLTISSQQINKSDTAIVNEDKPPTHIKLVTVPLNTF